MLAGEIESKTGISATTTPGRKSQFDVVLDGRVLWSKEEKGRFPEDDEIFSLLG
mgnify:CR=1 FL=1